MSLVAGTRSVIIVILAAALAMATAAVFVVRTSSAGWGTLERLFRNRDEHPHWELLAQ